MTCAGCPAAKTCTLILRGGAEQFLEETERSLHDAIMIVRRTIKNDSVVAGTFKYIIYSDNKTIVYKTDRQSKKFIFIIKFGFFLGLTRLAVRSLIDWVSKAVRLETYSIWLSRFLLMLMSGMFILCT